MIEKERRWQIFQSLAPYFGRVVEAKFLQKTSQYIDGIVRVHHLIEGIYE